MSELEFKFGEGYISGYLSAFLGLLSLGGVLCFLFPQYLTTAGIRESYNIDYLRLLLLTTLVLAFVFGAINFLFENGRTAGLIGLASAFIATLLGGPGAESEVTTYHELSLGLDWLVISVLFSALIFIPIEKFFPKEPKQ